MYPDDSLTLHTDLYQINIDAGFTSTKEFINKKAVFESLFPPTTFLKTVMLYLQVWNEL